MAKSLYYRLAGAVLGAALILVSPGAGAWAAVAGETAGRTAPARVDLVPMLGRGPKLSTPLVIPQGKIDGAAFHLLTPQLRQEFSALTGQAAARPGAALARRALSETGALVSRELKGIGDIERAEEGPAWDLGRKLQSALDQGSETQGGPITYQAADSFGKDLEGGRRKGGFDRLSSYDRNDDGGSFGSTPPPGSAEADQSHRLMSKVYGWMTAGLGVTALTAWWSVSSGLAASMSLPLVLGLVVAEFAIAIGLTAGINKIGPGTAKAGFFAFAAINGVMLAPLALVYTGASIASTFVITAGMFGGMAAYGHATKKDLSSVGHYALMALWGVILASLVNFFIKSSGMDFLLSLVSVGVFVGLTAYDAQKIRRFADEAGSMDSGMVNKVAAIGALQLYLDFINLFINLLKWFGKKRND